MRDLSTVAQEGSHPLGTLARPALRRSDPIRICSRPLIQTNLRLSASGLYHVRSRRVLQQSGPSHEVTPLPGIYFFDGESDPACRSQRTYPNRGTHPNVMFSAQRPQPLLRNHLKHQTRKHETYLPRLSRTKQRMDPAPVGQQFEPTNTCMPWSSSMDHNSKGYMRLPKNVTRSKGNDESSNTEASHKNFPPCHHNSRQSCCLSTLPDPWPLAKITINLDTASQL